MQRNSGRICVKQLSSIKQWIRCRQSTIQRIYCCTWQGSQQSLISQWKQTVCVDIFALFVIWVIEEDKYLADYTCMHACMHSPPHTHNCFTALWNLSGTTQVSRYQEKHSLTHIYRGHLSPLICFIHLYDTWHPQQSFITGFSVLTSLCLKSKCWHKNCNSFTDSCTFVLNNVL